MIQPLGRYTGWLIILILVVSQLLILINWKKIALPIRYFGFFLFWNFLIEVTARILAYSGVNNLPLLHIYTLVELILFAVFYAQLNPFKGHSKKMYWGIVSIICLLIIGNSIFLQPIYGFNSYAKTIVQITLIGLALQYFFFDATTTEPTPGRAGIRILNAAVLTYYSGSLFIFMFSDFFYRRHNVGLPNDFWLFNVFLNLVFQILVLIAIWRATSDNRKYSF